MRLVSWEEMCSLSESINVTWFRHQNGVQINSSYRMPWKQTIRRADMRWRGDTLYMLEVCLEKSMYTEGEYWLPYTEGSMTRTMTNEGNSKCLYCSCPTEMKRDFATFGIREFCPRCKI